MRSTAFLIAAAAVAAAFLWFGHLAGGASSQLTAEYTRALASGHGYLGIAPDPRLLALADPYDPAANRAYRLLDACLYRGRYYLYYGVTPFLTILVPWLWLTGRQLSESEVIAAYGLGTLLCLALLLGDAARRYFPRAGAVARALALAGVALAGAELLLLRRPLIYEMAIASACFHDCAALLCAYAALHDRRRRLLWLSLAGLNAGLAVAARASHVGIAALVTVFILWQSGGPAGRWRRAAVALAPLALVALGVAGFNAARFGSPFDFGFRYLLVDVENFGSNFSSLRYEPYNLWQYVLGWPRLSGWFPFIEGPVAPPFALPRGYYSVDQVYGLVVMAPLVLCGLALPARWSKFPSGLRSSVGLALGFGVVNLLFLAIIDATAYRYTADFLPYLLLTGAFGLLALSAEWNSQRSPGAAWKLGGGLILAGVSILASFCAAFALSDIARQANPVAFERVGRIFNQPRLWWEQVAGTPLRALAVRTRLPQDKFGKVEPLLVTGRTSLQDFLYLYYAGPGYLQVGFEAGGRGGPVSALVPVDYAQPVAFELLLGYRWPPAGASAYAGLTTAEVGSLRRRLLVKVNGQVALDTWVDFHPTKELYFWGTSPDDDAFGSRYTGSPLQLSQTALPAIGDQDAGRYDNYGPVRLSVTRAAGAKGRETLVAMGYRGRWQFVDVVYADDRRVRFVARSYLDQGESTSAPVDLPPGGVHQLTISAGGLLPPLESHLWQTTSPAERRKLRGQTTVTLDGAIVLEAAEGAPEVGPAGVAIGKSPPGFPDGAAPFSGEIEVRGRSNFIR